MEKIEIDQDYKTTKKDKDCFSLLNEALPEKKLKLLQNSRFSVLIERDEEEQGVGEEEEQQGENENISVPISKQTMEHEPSNETKEPKPTKQKNELEPIEEEDTTDFKVVITKKRLKRDRQYRKVNLDKEKDTEDGEDTEKEKGKKKEGEGEGEGENEINIEKYHVFKDVQDWKSLRHYGIVYRFDYLKNLGKRNKWKWWHGYQEDTRKIEQFQFNRNGSISHTSLEPSSEYLEKFNRFLEKRSQSSSSSSLPLH